MRRTLFIVTFAFSMLLSNSIWAQEFIVDGIKYSVLSAENRTVEVISNGWSSYTGDIVIPETVEYDDAIYNVTAVGESAFWFCSDMTSVVIPNSVTVINRRAFAFCWNAGNIQLPANVVTIGDEAFMVCSGIRTINIPSSVTSIGENAFAIFSENDPDVNTYYIETLNWNCNLDFSVIAKSFMGEYNRVRDYNVRNLVIGKDVTRFNFYDAPYDPIFERYNYLYLVESISVDEDNSMFDSRNNCNAIINTSENKLIAGVGATVIPNSVTSIGECAFMARSELESIAIPSSVTSIGHDAFADCSNLESFSISSAVRLIDYKTFMNCTSLEAIEIPTNLTSIGYMAFYGCTSLRAIEFPASLIRIYSRAFYGCSELSSVTVYSGTPPILENSYDNIFGENADGRKIYVFSDLVETYKEALEWRDFNNDGIAAIPDLTANNAGGELGNWCSYYNGMADVKLSDDVIIYKASLDGDNVRLTEIDGHIINKGNAVLLKSTSDAITLESAPEMVVGDYSDNELAGIDTPKAQSDGKIYYVISKVADAFGFYKLNPEVLLGAHKAYLEVENISMAPMRSYYGFGLSADGTETVISEPIVEDKGDWYTVYGTKLNGRPIDKGLYIHNGKKYLIK